MKQTTRPGGAQSHLPADVVKQLLACIRRHRPSTVSIACNTYPPAEHLQRELIDESSTIQTAIHNIAADNDGMTQRYDLAYVIIDAADQSIAPRQRRLLCHLRDTGAARVVAAVNRGPATAGWWQIGDFIALGYRRSAGSRALTSDWVLYYYDIHDYKTTPDWLNKRYWANPERWDEERW